MGMMPGLKAFVAAILGGIGSIPGAMLGGFILGITETFTRGFISSQYADALSFSILIIVLLIKPTGILGKKIIVKV
jgi:branched-chain amino acid transport system permease protein